MTVQMRPAELVSISALSDVAGDYDLLLCDVWGVVHDGRVKSPAAEAALTAARKAGTKVVLVTNSPRPSAGVVGQLDALNVSRDAYDGIVTSGDATRALIAAGPKTVFHIGLERDLDLYDGLGVETVDEDEAEVVVVTGLVRDEEETTDDYADLLSRLAARGLPMICANPDIVVHRGETLVYCAGALGEAYAALGGKVSLAGKPHAPIYEVALERAGLAEPHVLCIGDGLHTDVKGAASIGADVLFVQEGIHREELAAFRQDVAGLSRELAARGVTARYVMPELR